MKPDLDPIRDRAKWLERRRHYLGASDAAAALGLSPYTSRLELWRDKLGDKADLPSAVMERGNVLEAVVAELYRRESGHEIEKRKWTASADHPFMACTPDLYDKNAGCIVQLKTHSSWTRHSWGDAQNPRVPNYEVIQCQHEIAVTGYTADILYALFADESAFRGMVAMAKGGFRPEAIADHVESLIADGMAETLPPIVIRRDDDMIADIIEGEREFWESYVLTKTPPPDASTPQESPDILDATSEQAEVLARLRQAKLDENAAAERYAEERVQIEEAIGAHSGIVARGIARVTYRAPAPRSETDWQGVAGMLATQLGREVPEPQTWESIAKVLALDLADDDMYAAAVDAFTHTTQGNRRFCPRFEKE